MWLKSIKSVIIALLTICSGLTYAQVASLNPANPTSEQQVVVTFDAAGTPLSGETKIYMHSGVVTTNTATPGGGDWKFVKGNWGQDDGIGQMTAVSGQPNKWQITLTPTLRNYYGVSQGTNIFWVAMVFRNSNGSKQTSPDLFLPISVPAYVTIDTPTASSVFVETGASILISATASSQATSMEMLIDEGSGFAQVATVANSSTITHNYTPNSESISVKVKATINSLQVETISNFTFTIRPTLVVADLPDGVKDGINYGADPTKVTLVLLAPGKEFVYVVGDFSGWILNNTYFMNKTPDGKRFWLEISGLTSGQEYVFQYWVDGTIKIGDPLADKVADPYNDSFIPVNTYPNLPAYTKTEYGIATVLQTNQNPYTWAATESSWVAPDKKSLVIYELLIRDFLGSRSYKDLADTIPYLKRLGVNAIELMPIMEFEGNLSWGYNPSYFLAPDKFYGSKNDLKKFIEKAHANGIAVIMDMVLNHAFGQNAMVQMYFNKTSNKPATNSPWFNPDATHPFNVGYDFNHESQYTKDFVDTVCSYWLKEYHVDGYRFDLSKGFTQTNNPSNVGAWSAFDQSRINILSRMATEIWKVKSSAYVILEHFADSQEETVLANQGMLLWGNLTGTYSSALNGNSQSDLSGAKRVSYVNYMESHDEERQLVELLNKGASSGSYNIKELDIALNRAKLGAAFFYTIPGPKMLWQFEELGYDKSINLCPNGTINTNCRVDNKPLPWGTGSLNYYSDSDRQRLYKTIASINKLIQSNKSTFDNGSFVWSPTGDLRNIKITHTTMDVAIVGNFSLTYKEASAIFTKTGTWYDYFSGGSEQVDDINKVVLLAPGEFHIYTSVKQPTPEPGLVDFVITSIMEEDNLISVYPNPTDNKIIRFNLPESTQNKTSVQIFNVLGQLLFDKEFLSTPETIELDVHFLSYGFYLVSIESGKQHVVTKLLIR